MHTSHATTALPDAVRSFLASPRFAIIATVNPDGSPHQAVVWYLLEDDGVVINSAVGRRWPSNLRRDQRVSFAVEDGIEWVSLRGRVEIVDEQPRAQADIAAMAHRYSDPETARRSIEGQFQREQRISFRLRPTAIHAELYGDAGAEREDA